MPEFSAPAVDPLAALAVDLYGRPRGAMWARIFAILFVSSGNWKALVLIRLIQAAEAGGRTRRAVGAWASRSLRREFGCFVHPKARIGPGLRLPHPNGIVIGAGARIGARCTIYHQVTLGGARSGDGGGANYPRIGDEVTLFAGAKLIGGVEVGSAAVIGANALVNRDVPPRHAAGGVPAKAWPIGGRADPDAKAPL